MKIEQIAQHIDEIAPLKLAQDWDNVGLLIGENEKNIKSALLTIDITSEVAAEAKKLGVDLIISYHPVIWDGLKQLRPDGDGAVVYELIRSDIAVFSIHTALDASIGGVNDGLAEIVGIKDAKPIGDYVQTDLDDKYKLVVFVPIEAVAEVSDAVFKAGAGHIGNYSNCGFGAQGQGTFKPLAGAKPAIGKKNKFEKVPEIRFETIAPAGIIESVIAAMKNAHPYEEPAYDVIKLCNEGAKFGLGRIGELEKGAKLADIIERIKKYTKADAIGIIGRENRQIKTAAVCAGSCGMIINQVIAAKADLYLTGELKHHQAIAAQEADLTCICLSHSVSERFMLKKLAGQLEKRLGGVKLTISKKDRDPFKWKKI